MDTRDPVCALQYVRIVMTSTTTTLYVVVCTYAIDRTQKLRSIDSRVSRHPIEGCLLDT